MATCSVDIVTWVNDWCWTYDPRRSPSTLPFILFPQQEKYLLWLVDREKNEEGGIAEKCRDVGFTWLSAAFLLHRWLFKPEFKGSIGSRKLDLIDKSGDPDSIFWKLRFLLYNLPLWMRPYEFVRRKHDGYCKLLHPLGNAITGEGGDQIGRGGRSTVYLVDEFAFVERSDTVVAALSQTTKVPLFVSTPNGVGNAFERMRNSGAYPVFTFRWKDDPRKNEFVVFDQFGKEVVNGNGEYDASLIPEGGSVSYPWYEEQLAKFGSVVVAQEIDIEYGASLDNMVIPAKYVQAAVNLPIEAKGALRAGLDIASGGKNETILIFRRGPKVTDVLVCPFTNLTLQAGWVKDQMELYQCPNLSFDAAGIGKSITDALDAMGVPLSFERHGVMGGDSPSEVVWSNGRTSKEFIINRRAEYYWLLRQRFEKSFYYRLYLEGKPGGVKYPPEELISIPQCPKLESQLSYPLFFRNSAGKIQIESKQDMKKRGVESPDHADALAYTENTDVDWEQVAKIMQIVFDENTPFTDYQSETFLTQW